MSDGICPFATWRPTGNFGYPRGSRAQNRPDVFVCHIMDGWKRTLDDPGWREPNGVGVHFGIGDDGSVSQYTNIFDASRGNGVSGSIERFDRRNRHLAAWERLPGARWVEVEYVGTTAYALLDGRGVNVPNSHSVSIEHEGRPEGRWTAAKREASVAVIRWCIAEVERVLGVRMAADVDLLAGHFQIDAVHRARCPGPNWPKSETLAALQPAEEEDVMATKEELRELLRAELDARRSYVQVPGHDAVYEIVNSERLVHAVNWPVFAEGGAEYADVRQLDPAKPDDRTVLELPVTYPRGVPRQLGGPVDIGK